MCHAELVSRLSQLTSNPSEVVYSITMQTVIAEIVNRMGINCLSLSPEDLQLALDETRSVLEHNLDEREYISEALDAWEVIRHL